MTEQSGKVTLDYTFYNGQDQYSDGDIENDLLQLIMEESDVEKILCLLYTSPSPRDCS